ncbi:MAG TPA: hypothetical protein VMI32_09620 [Candidatus Solibacter sp.]|nr:hypothetical protein [Candidatus Solibacter sp.]
MRNLWPQPYSPSAWNAYVKDDLEDRLHAMVCDGQIELSTAQHAIASDWIGAYKTYFHTQEPLAKHENRLAGQIRREHNWPVWLISTLQPLA